MLETAPCQEGNEATPPSPLRIVEALLFVGGAPLTAKRVCEIIRGFSSEQFTQVLDALNHAYRAQNRPYAILSPGEAYAPALLRPSFAGCMGKIVRRPAARRLSMAAIDVLAPGCLSPTGHQGRDRQFCASADSGGLLRQLARAAALSRAIYAPGRRPWRKFPTARRRASSNGSACKAWTICRARRIYSNCEKKKE